jgi:hypothetical protein
LFHPENNQDQNWRMAEKEILREVFTGPLAEPFADLEQNWR